MREIASVDVSETTADEPDAEIYTKQTVDDLSTMATWDGEIKEEFDADSNRDRTNRWASTLPNR